MILKKMHWMAFSKLQRLQKENEREDNTSHHLKDQFDAAHQFFIRKIELHSQRSDLKSYDKILTILKADQNKSTPSTTKSQQTKQSDAPQSAPLDGSTS